MTASAVRWKRRISRSSRPGAERPPARELEAAAGARHGQRHLGVLRRDAELGEQREQPRVVDGVVDDEPGVDRQAVSPRARRPCWYARRRVAHARTARPRATGRARARHPGRRCPYRLPRCACAEVWGHRAGQRRIIRTTANSGSVFRKNARVGIEHRGRDHRSGRDRARADVVAQPDHHVRGRRRTAARAAAGDGHALGRRRRPDRPGAVLRDVRDLRPRHLARVPPLLHAPLVPGAAVVQGHARDPRLDDAAGPGHAVGDRPPQAPRAVRPARRPALAAHPRRRHVDRQRLRHVARARRLAVPHEGHGARRPLRPRPARGSDDPPGRPPLLRLGRASRSRSRS